MLAPTGVIGAATLAKQLGTWRPDGPRPAYLALAAALRLLVLDGRVPVGTALPSERGLADALAVSRTTVAGAYAELRESGHLHSRPGARSQLRLPVTVPAEPADSGTEGELIRLNIAAPSAPQQIVHEAYRHAMEAAPPYLGGTGLYPAGVRALRESVARRFCERGLTTTAEQILVTSGAQHGLRLVLDAMVSPGERILVEQPTHHGTILAIRRHSARPIAMSMHPEHGWDLDHLEALVRQQSPRLIFAIPDFHNPTGLLMSIEDRIRLGEISARHRVPVVVDETMAELGLDGAAPPPVAALAPAAAQIITLGSASKTVWAGLRVGWVRTADAPDRFTSARYELDLGGAVFEQLAACYALDHLGDFLPARVAALRAARAMARRTLAREIPDATVVRGVGGLCLWVTLPRPVATATAVAAAGLGVRLAPGAVFGIDGGLERNIRIPYTLPPAVLEDAIGRVGQAYRVAAGGPAMTGHRLADQLVV